MAKMIDLGREYDCCTPCCDAKSDSSMKKKSYPTLYISGVKGLDLSTGEITFTAKGKVVSVSERETDRDGKTSEEYSCEIEVHSMSTDAEKGGLDSAMDKIASKKYVEDTDDDEE